MIRGNNRQQIFFNEKYCRHFLTILKDSTEKFDHRFLAYCLMSNHAHLVIYIAENDLPSIMRYINFRYAFWVNRKNDRVGHLFQGRYRSIEVSRDTYLINLCRYVHFNPVEARMVNNVCDYPWSSHRYYLHNTPPKWLDIQPILQAIKNRTGLSYAHFMNQPAERAKWKPAFYLDQNGSVIFDTDIVCDLREQNKERDIAPILSTQDVVTQIVCRHLTVEALALYGASRNHVISKQRTLLITYLLRYTNLTMTEIAKTFQRTMGTLSRQVSQLQESPEKFFPKMILENIKNDLEDAH